MIRPATRASRLSQSFPLACRNLSANALRSFIVVLASTATLAACSLLTATPIAAQQEFTVRLADHTPPQILDGNALYVRRYDLTQKLRLTLSINPPRLAEEEQFLRELTDKTSPNFHQFLSPEEWNARFAPSAEDEQAVVDWAESHGLTVTNRFNHRLIVDVEAPAAVVEKAFGVTMNSYSVQGERDLKFSNDRNPVIPASLAHIIHNIQGLNNIQHDHGSSPGSAQIPSPDYAEGPPAAMGAEAHGDADPSKLPPALAASLAAEAGSAEDAGPAEIANGPAQSNAAPITNGKLNPTGVFSSQVYNYDGLQNLGHCCNPHHDANGTPNVSNIAISAFGNWLATDVQGFGAAYPYLAYNVSGFAIDGTIPCTPAGKCASAETSQDIQWSMATANSFASYKDTAHVYVYVGANYNNSTFTDMYSFMLSDNLARVFTTSWSCTESYGCSNGTMDDRHNIFNAMVGQGWTIIAASGDRGSSDDCYLPKGSSVYNTAHESVAYPASDYQVLAAGGTILNVDGSGNWTGEKAWQGGTYFGACAQNNGGSGGGVSSHFAKQDWQSFLSGDKRKSPDISLNALGIGQNVYVNGAFGGSANGTSVVAPELAGFFAQENAYLNYIGHKCGAAGNAACTPVGNPMPYFYNAAHSGYPYVSHLPFYDITVGCNNNDVTASQGLGSYCSKVGWDYVTGWGSANMLQLAWAVNWYIIPANGVPSVTFTGPAKNKWYSNGQIVSWKINDNGGGTYPGSGIAGFTQGWDSIAPDSISKPHGGTGDSYWTGPQYANVSTGCLSLISGVGGCAGGVSQGCHTAHVRGWNNQGWTTGDQAYGPLCFDSIAPVSKAALAGTLNNADGWYSTSVIVTLSATDAGTGNGTGSGVAQIFYAVDFPSCTTQNPFGCKKYTGPVTVSTGGPHSFYFYSADNAGNYEARHTVAVNIDLSAPTTAPSTTPTPTIYGWNHTAVGVTLTATDPAGPGVLQTFYALNTPTCTPAATATCSKYTGQITISALGTTKVSFFSKDKSGNFETLKSTSVMIDEVAPSTSATLAGTKSSSQAGWFTTAVSVTLAATDPGSVASGVAKTYYAVDNPACTPAALAACLTYSAPVNVSTGGAHKFTYFSQDKAGNFETLKSVAVNIILGPPVTKLAVAPLPNPAGWNTTSVSVTLTATDPGPGIKATYWALDSTTCSTAAVSTCTKYTAPFAITAVGKHVVTFFSQDNFGTFEAAHAQAVNIDETAPVTTAALAGTLNNGVYFGPVTVTLHPTDALSGVQITKFKINGGALQTYSVPFKISVAGIYSIQYATVDNAGNVETTRTITFTERLN